MTWMIAIFSEVAVSFDLDCILMSSSVKSRFPMKWPNCFQLSSLFPVKWPYQHSVCPLHRKKATSLETYKLVHRKMQLHWKRHSSSQSTLQKYSISLEMGIHPRSLKLSVDGIDKNCRGLNHVIILEELQLFFI